jgi:subtilisin family serine protease
MTDVGIPRDLIEYILLGSGDSRRLIQDSPILIDVWDAYARQPSAPIDLLIAVHRKSTAHELAAEIYRGIKRSGEAKDDPEITPLQGIVAARLYFGELLTVLVPLTAWWQDRTTRKELEAYTAVGSEKLNETIEGVLRLLARWRDKNDSGETTNGRSALERFIALCTLVSLASWSPWLEKERKGSSTKRIKEASVADIGKVLRGFLNLMVPKRKPMIFRIDLNRTAAPAIAKSVPTVKADAARRLFDLDYSEINWAVLDSGVDGSHPAFGGRVRATYDFTNYRHIVNIANDTPAVRAKNFAALEKARGVKLPQTVETKLRQIAQVLRSGRPVPWDLVGDVVRIKKPGPPTIPHGTHVAGIIGACKYDDDSANGMCPGIGLYDFRVLVPESVAESKDDQRENTEVATIAALQFIRHLNEQKNLLLIAGVNMSLQIQHDVKNYACGRTLICDESERLVDGGVVVVAAAGNVGAGKKREDNKPFEDFQFYSIADPGNAERVITVGATHRDEPFNYGVSYFSCRGPTGDGRLKPDLVAPGESITGPVLDHEWGELDGTSQATPHVSGAAAMLMARYPELIGKPDRIKQILCDTATDLGRQRNFQGHGLLDVLRALQSQ